jgi:hypothetical protein
MQRCRSARRTQHWVVVVIGTCVLTCSVQSGVAAAIPAASTKDVVCGILGEPLGKAAAKKLPKIVTGGKYSGGNVLLANTFQRDANPPIVLGPTWSRVPGSSTTINVQWDAIDFGGSVRNFEVWIFTQGSWKVVPTQAGDRAVQVRNVVAANPTDPRRARNPQQRELERVVLCHTLPRLRLVTVARRASRSLGREVTRACLRTRLVPQHRRGSR